MRAVVLTAFAALLMGAGVARAGDEVADRFSRLTRGSAWEPRAAVPVSFDTHHPQGFAAVGEALFVSTVEIIEPTRKFGAPQEGYDRTPGRGRGHLVKMSRDGRRLGGIEVGEGDVYHPGGIDYDGRWLWVPVAEYRPNSASIIYKVDPESLEATEVFRVRDHIGGIVHDPQGGALHAVSWGSRRLYTWQVDGEGRPTGDPGDLSAHRTLNPAHYVDYQDCALAGPGFALCSGVSEFRPDPTMPKWSLGGLELVDLAAGRPTHQVPVLLWTESGEAMTRNPVLIEPAGGGLRATFMPEDGRSTLYTYEVALD